MIETVVHVPYELHEIVFCHAVFAGRRESMTFGWREPSPTEGRARFSGGRKSYLPDDRGMRQNTSEASGTGMPSEVRRKAGLTDAGNPKIDR